MIRVFRSLKFRLFSPLLVGVLLSGLAIAKAAEAYDRASDSCFALLTDAPEKRGLETYLKLIAQYREALNDDTKFGEALASMMNSGKFFELSKPPSLGIDGEKYLRQIGQSPKIDQAELEKMIRKEFDVELKGLSRSLERIATATESAKIISLPMIELEVTAKNYKTSSTLPGGQELVSTVSDEILILDLKSGKVLNRLPLPVHDCTAQAVSADGATVLFAGKDRSLVAFDLKTGSVLWKTKATVSAFRKLVNGVRLRGADLITEIIPDADFTRAFVRNGYAEIQYRDLKTGKVLALWGDRDSSFQFMRDAGEGAVLGSSIARGWKIARPSPSKRKLLVTSIEESEKFNTPFLSKDGKSVWGIASDGTFLNEWNSVTGKISRRIETPGKIEWISGDRKHVIYTQVRGGEEFSKPFLFDVVFWDIESAKEVSRFTMDNGRSHSILRDRIEESPDGKELALSIRSTDDFFSQPVALWKPESGNPPKFIHVSTSGQSQKVSGMTVYPGGRLGILKQQKDWGPGVGEAYSVFVQDSGEVIHEFPNAKELRKDSATGLTIFSNEGKIYVLDPRMP